MNTEDNITADVLYDKLMELIDKPPDETADKKKGICHKLTSGGAYQEWIFHLEKEPIFNADDYNPQAA